MAVKKYYAVKAGKVKGIYATWAQCKAQVHGYPGALFKSFTALEEAKQYMEGQVRPANSVMDEDAIDEEQYHIYVDGSYYDKAYSWGFAAYLGNKLIHTANGRGTNKAAAQIHNVAGELEAAVQAVEWAQKEKIKRITIHHDYVGISEWAEKRWKTNNEITKQYALFMSSHLNWVDFKKVTGHSGVEGNELADKLAKAALK